MSLTPSLYSRFRKTKKTNFFSLNATIGFDREGREILKRNDGKSFLMDQNIRNLWTHIEIILSKPGINIKNLKELYKKIPARYRNDDAINIIQKLFELNLITFNTH